MILIFLSWAVALGSIVRAHELKDLKMDQLDYLYARHDDDRLLKMACTRALLNDAKGAFYLGALFSEPDGFYYRPRSAFLWLTIAKELGSDLADPFIALTFPAVSSSEIRRIRERVTICRNSNFTDCKTDDEQRVTHFGWPQSQGLYVRTGHKG